MRFVIGRARAAFGKHGADVRQFTTGFDSRATRMTVANPGTISPVPPAVHRPRPGAEKIYESCAANRGAKKISRAASGNPHNSQSLTLNFP
jgi:hypothetical protein